MAPFLVKRALTLRISEAHGNTTDDSLTRIEQKLTLRLLFGEVCLRPVSFQAVVLSGQPAGRPPIGDLARKTLRSGQYEVVFFPSVHIDERGGMLQLESYGIRYSPPGYPLYYVNLTPSFDEYLKKFSSSSRKNLRRDLTKFKELSGRGDDCIREYRRPEEMRDFHRHARSISQVTFQERLLGVGLPDTPEFIEQLIRDAEDDLVRSYILFDKERPVAFVYCAGRNRHLTYRTIGYDPEYRDYSPGRTLLYVILERLFAERRFDLLDFGPGEAFYKSFFATDSWMCVDVYVFRYTPSNMAFILSHVGLSATSRSLVRITTALGIKEKLKKWARQNLGR
jgi:hypothetical protein